VIVGSFRRYKIGERGEGLWWRADFDVKRDDFREQPFVVVRKATAEEAAREWAQLAGKPVPTTHPYYYEISTD